MEAFMGIRFATVAAAVLFLSCGLSAQEKRVRDPAESKEENTLAYIQLLRSDLKASKRAVIKESMQLDEKQSAAFWPLYNPRRGADQACRPDELAHRAVIVVRFFQLENQIQLIVDLQIFD
jgi:hypothetical protein